MKNRKKWFLVSLVCVIAGILIMAAGMLMGGKPGFYIDSSGIHTSRETADIKPLRGKWRELQKFEELEIDVDYADIEIETSDRFAVKYYLSGRYQEPVCEVKDGKFIFREGDHSRLINFGFFESGIGIAEEDYYVKVEIPRDHKFSSVMLHTESGDITASQVHAEGLEIQNEYGNLDLSKFQGEKLAINMESGDFIIGTLKAGQADIRNEYGNFWITDVEGNSLKAYQGSGNCLIDRMAVSDVEIQNEYGDVTLDVDGGVKSYDLDLNTEYGSIEIGNHMIGQEDYNDEQHYTSKADGEKKIKINC